MVLSVCGGAAADAGVGEVHASSCGEGVVNEPPERLLAAVLPRQPPQALQRGAQVAQGGAKSGGIGLQALLLAALLGGGCEEGGAGADCEGAEEERVIALRQALAQAREQHTKSCSWVVAGGCMWPAVMPACAVRAAATQAGGKAASSCWMRAEV